MSSIDVKTFAEAEEVNDNFDHAKIEPVYVGGQKVAV